MSEKAKKAHPVEVDISNGALFLRINELERQVKYLMGRVDAMEPALKELSREVAFHGRNIDFRVGGNH